MRVDIVIILVAVLMVAVIGWVAYQKNRREQAEFNRRFAFDEEEGIESMWDEAHNKPFQFQGNGAQTTRHIKLEAGNYKIRYRFPEGVTIKVELLSADGTDSE